MCRSLSVSIYNTVPYLHARLTIQTKTALFRSTNWLVVAFISHNAVDNQKERSCVDGRPIGAGTSTASAQRS